MVLLVKDNLGSKMKILKFLGIHPRLGSYPGSPVLSIVTIPGHCLILVYFVSDENQWAQIQIPEPNESNLIQYFTFVFCGTHALQKVSKSCVRKLGGHCTMKIYQ